ncbi:unnamed protein product [Adineta steineri]|uniref:Biopterin-dependent aromatic amino acid hydroxylase family profile domain-containing protein n=1 Tax=Adineta steineri TaxID=433720 RepID=A0A815NKG3_9BILA|nr:unnamed protein product [Adineta steineri]CAF3598005.1 unnamed protein product [Adineta steineri]
MVQISETFEDAKEKLRLFAKSLKRPYELVYDVHTQSLQILDNVKVIHQLSSKPKLEVDCLHKKRMNFRVI